MCTKEPARCECVPEDPNRADLAGWGLFEAMGSSTFPGSVPAIQSCDLCALLGSDWTAAQSVMARVEELIGMAQSRWTRLKADAKNAPEDYAAWDRIREAEHFNQWMFVYLPDADAFGVMRGFDANHEPIPSKGIEQDIQDFMTWFVELGDLANGRRSPRGM